MIDVSFVSPVVDVSSVGSAAAGIRHRIRQKRMQEPPRMDNECLLVKAGLPPHPPLPSPMRGEECMERMRRRRVREQAGNEEWIGETSRLAGPEPGSGFLALFLI